MIFRPLHTLVGVPQGFGKGHLLGPPAVQCALTILMPSLCALR